MHRDAHEEACCCTLDRASTCLQYSVRQNKALGEGTAGAAMAGSRHSATHMHEPHKPCWLDSHLLACNVTVTVHRVLHCLGNVLH